MLRILRSISLVLACLVGPAPASAYQLWLERVNPLPVEVSDTVEVEVHLDTEGDTGLLNFSVAVVYPEANLSYEPSLSGSPSYILYFPDPPGPTILYPRDIAAGSALGEWPGISDQVNVDYWNPSIIGGNLATTTRIESGPIFRTCSG